MHAFSTIKTYIKHMWWPSLKAFTQDIVTARKLPIFHPEWFYFQTLLSTVGRSVLAKHFLPKKKTNHICFCFLLAGCILSCMYTNIPEPDPSTCIRSWILFFFVLVLDLCTFVVYLGTQSYLFYPYTYLFFPNMSDFDANFWIEKVRYFFVLS